MSLEKIRLRASALVIKDGAVLLIEFENDNDNGVHYNLPAGGLEPGETLVEAVIREAKEEASVDIEVGSVAFIYEYQPTKSNYIYGDTHSVGVTFECKLKEGSEPKLPGIPDPKQTAVKWIPIAELHTIQLYPEITQDIMDYYSGVKYRNYVEEQEIQKGKLLRQQKTKTGHMEFEQLLHISHLDLTKNDIDLLLEESISEGYRHLQRLVKEYKEGVNRFDRPGEALYSVSLNEEIVAVCGLNIDPYSTSLEIGRIRRLYVLKRYRRSGLAKKLMEVVIEQARNNFKVLVLFTDNPVAEQFYSGIGFTASSSYPKSTHYFEF